MFYRVSNGGSKDYTYTLKLSVYSHYSTGAHTAVGTGTCTLLINDVSIDVISATAKEGTVDTSKSGTGSL